MILPIGFIARSLTADSASTRLDVDVDLAGIDTDSKAVFAHLLAGGRYGRFSRRVKEGVEVTPVFALAVNQRIPPGSTGEDVTYRVMVTVGFGPSDIALGNRIGTPIQFVALEGAPTWHPAKGAVAAALLAAWIVVCSGWSWSWTSTQYDASPAESVFLIGGAALFAIGLPLIFGAAAAGALGPGGPLHRRNQLLVPIGALAAAPIVLVGIVGTVHANALMRSWTEGVSGIEFVSPGLRGGFTADTFEIPELVPAEGAFDDFQSWGLVANVHPNGLPRYHAGDHGLIVNWTPDESRLDVVSFGLPPDLRATSPSDLAWVAYVWHGRIEDAYTWQGGTRSAVEWLNIRVVDVRTEQLVGHATAFGAPNTARSESPKPFYGVSAGTQRQLVIDAVRPSYE